MSEIAISTTETGAVEQPILDRAVAYWRLIDKTIGEQIAAKVGNQG
jgi:hypothetical protein